MDLASWTVIEKCSKSALGYMLNVGVGASLLTRALATCAARCTRLDASQKARKFGAAPWTVVIKDRAQAVLITMVSNGLDNIVYRFQTSKTGAGSRSSELVKLGRDVNLTDIMQHQNPERLL